jgi:alkanesulfonate monooxygenase SsuD/methylene tetrahydromethanopterin reductase-like flavin-dependent oxidoreductase (luciferase family)
VGRGRDPRTLVDLARAAEAAGWDGFFLADNLVADGGAPVLDTQSILAAIAGQTRRIRRGPLVTARPRRLPGRLAREAVTLDHLARGG